MTDQNVVPLNKLGRVAAIDQMRGYALFGMFLVNYFEHFDAMPYHLHHHRELFSYADTIAPLFLFVAGMGMRISIKRRTEREGLHAARMGLLGRYLILLCVGFAIYQGWVWDALTDIALSGLLALIVIDKKPVVRIVWAFLFLALFQLIILYTEYGLWMLGPDPWKEEFPLWVRLIPLHGELFDVNLNGGPFGFFSLMTLFLAGSLGYDLYMTRDTKKIISWGTAAAVVFFAAAWLFHSEWGSLKAEWVFSKRYSTVPFILLSTGTSFIALVAFYLICDVWNKRIPLMNVLGLNTFILYIVSNLFLESAAPFFPEETTNIVGILAGFLCFFGILYGAAWYMHSRKIIIKL